MADFLTFQLNDAAKALLSGNWMNANTINSILTEVAQEIIGPGGIAMDHFFKGQGRWPISDSWLTDKRKRGKRKFELHGRTLKAIRTRLPESALREFGSSADIKATRTVARMRKYFGPVYVGVDVRRNSADLVVGFAGAFKHSKGFQAARKAVTRRLQEKHGKKNVRRATAGQTERQMSIERAQLRKAGLHAFAGSMRKYEAVGSLGIKSTRRGGSFHLARDENNLAHANLLQRGVFKGVRSAKNPDHVFNPKATAKLKKTKPAALARGKGAAVYGVPRPILPLTTADERRITAALERGLTKIVDHLNMAA